MRRPGRRESLLLLFASFLVTAAFSARGDDPAAQLYAESCAPCHSIGKGAGVGPDLLPSVKKPQNVLHDAIERMEENVGELTDEQVDSLVELLKAPDVKQRLAALEQPGAATPEPAAAAPPPPPLPRGSEANGRRLFFGEQPLANGGSPCFGCHAVGARGGDLAVDLTLVQTRIGPSALLSATAKPPFPMMRAAYAQRPVTQEEALDLAAFLESAAKGQPPAALPQPESTLPVRLGAFSFVAVTFAAVALLFRSRRAGVRARLVRDSSER